MGCLRFARQEERKNVGSDYLDSSMATKSYAPTGPSGGRKSLTSRRLARKAPQFCLLRHIPVIHCNHIDQNLAMDGPEASADKRAVIEMSI